MEFTPKQLLLLEIAKQQGFLLRSDFIRVFSSKSARRNALDKFLALGILEHTCQINKLNLVKK